MTRDDAAAAFEPLAPSIEGAARHVARKMRLRRHAAEDLAGQAALVAWEYLLSAESLPPGPLMRTVVARGLYRYAPLVMGPFRLPPGRQHGAPVAVPAGEDVPDRPASEPSGPCLGDVEAMLLAPGCPVRPRDAEAISRALGLCGHARRSNVAAARDLGVTEKGVRTAVARVLRLAAAAPECSECGATFAPSRPKQATCSRECAVARYNRLTRERYRKNSR